jgi:hypothetical protein
VSAGRTSAVGSVPASSGVVSGAARARALSAQAAGEQACARTQPVTDSSARRLKANWQVSQTEPRTNSSLANGTQVSQVSHTEPRTKASFAFANGASNFRT